MTNVLDYNKSLELGAMIRVNGKIDNYYFNVDGDYHYRPSNNLPFNTVNTMAYVHLENMLKSELNIIGISIKESNFKCYIIELFGFKS